MSELELTIRMTVGVIFAGAVIALALVDGISRGREEQRFGLRRWNVRRWLTRKSVHPSDRVIQVIQSQWSLLPSYPDPSGYEADRRYLFKEERYGLEVGLAGVSTAPAVMEQFAALMAEQGWKVEHLKQQRYQFRQPGWRLSMARWTRWDVIFQLRQVGQTHVTNERRRAGRSGGC